MPPKPIEQIEESLFNNGIGTWRAGVEDEVIILRGFCGSGSSDLDWILNPFLTRTPPREREKGSGYREMRRS